MRWHVIAQIGNDDYLPVVPAEDARFIVSIDKPGSEHSVAQHLLSRVFDQGLMPSPAALDLVHVATIVYTADLRVWRGYGEEGWTRDITLHVPVTQPDLWRSAAAVLTELLSFLTGDEWGLQFREKAPPEEIEVGDAQLTEPGAVCLFPGDSTPMSVPSTCLRQAPTSPSSASMGTNATRKRSSRR